MLSLPFICFSLLEVLADFTTRTRGLELFRGNSLPAQIVMTLKTVNWN